MTRKVRHRGFTLMELVVVMLIISFTAALAAPAWRGWSDGAKLRSVVDALLADLSHARASAVLNAQTASIAFGADGWSPNLPGSSAADQPAEPLPTGFSVQLVQGGEAGEIRFHADSRATPALIRVTSARGEVVDIACDTPAAPFAVAGRAP